MDSRKNQLQRLNELMDRNITPEYRELIHGLGFSNDSDGGRNAQNIFGQNELNAPENSDRKFRYAAVLKLSLIHI